MNMKKYTLLLALLLVGVLTGYSQQSAYLFVYFTGNRMSGKPSGWLSAPMDTTTMH